MTWFRKGLLGAVLTRLDMVESASWQLRQMISGENSPQYPHWLISSMGEPHRSHAAPTGVCKPHHEQATPGPISSATNLLSLSFFGGWRESPLPTTIGRFGAG
jgi:hypothetical protein